MEDHRGFHLTLVFILMINWFKDGNLSCSWGALIPVYEDGRISYTFIQRDFWSAVEFTEDSRGKIEGMMYDGKKGIRVSK
jgi:hypothetical protein